MTEDECVHYLVEDVEKVDGIFMGVCAKCRQNVSATGDEDEAGVPGWEALPEFAEWRGTQIEVTS